MRKLRSAAAQARGTEVLHRDDARVTGELEARFHQALFQERVAHLHRRAPRLTGGVELYAREACPVDAVTPRVGAHQEHYVSWAASTGTRELFVRHHAHAHRIHDAVVAIYRIEVHLAAHRRDADAVAIAADTRDHPVEEMLLMRLVERSEPQRGEKCDRPCSHGEDVAQDPADTGGGALGGLDGAGMVVRLDLEDAGQPLTDVHRTGVLTRALEHLRSASGQAAKQRLAGFVAAVLAPESAQDAELDVVRRSAELRGCGVVFAAREPNLGELRGRGPGPLGRRHRHRAAAAPAPSRASERATDLKSRMPSSDPRSF